MDTTYSGVIEKYIKDAQQNGQSPSLKAFVEAQREYVIKHSKVGEDTSAVWGNRIIKVAKRLQVQLAKTKVKPDWPGIAYEIVRRASECEKEEQQAEDSESTTPVCGAKRSRSSNGTNSKYDSLPVTPEMKETFKKKFEAMNTENKWQLREGVYVEDLMYEFGKNCDFEKYARSPVHSFILCPDDTCWKDVFTEEDLLKINNRGCPALPALSNQVQKVFNLMEKEPEETGRKNIEKILYERLADLGLLNPLESFEEHWVQRTILHFISLCNGNVIARLARGGSETDLITRIWSIFDTCFDDIDVETKR